MIAAFSSGLLSSVLLYMHKADPAYSLVIPFLVFFMPTEAAIYFSIIAVAAIIEDKKYRIPDFVIILSVFPLFYDKTAGLISALLYCLPLLVIYTVSEIMGKKLLLPSDIKLFFSVGVFFRSTTHILPLYVLTLISLIPYSLLKKKLVPLGPPAAVAAYVIYVFFNGVI